MDSTEAAAEAFLLRLNLRPVTYEPDGNIPPDFTLGPDIAVEVRRLNEHHASVGLEVEDIPLLQRLRRLALELGGPGDGITWGIFYHFSRPLERWKTLRPKIIAALQDYEANHAPTRRFIKLGASFQMTVFRYPVLKSTRYFIAGNADDDSGGSLIPLMETNIAHCIADKTLKIAPYRSRYPKWWLVLVDSIGFGFDSLEQELFKQQVSLAHTWDRVVVVSHRDPALSIDV